MADSSLTYTATWYTDSSEVAVAVYLLRGNKSISAVFQLFEQQLIAVLVEELLEGSRYSLLTSIFSESFCICPSSYCAQGWNTGI